MIHNKDLELLALARQTGSLSKDRSRKVGAVVADRNFQVRVSACNGFPQGARQDIDERYERPLKYLWTEHAERNAIYAAARNGISIENCTMYVPWFPCMDCARAIVQSGISRLVAMAPDTSDSIWGEHFVAATELLIEAGVQVDFAEDFAVQNEISS